MLTDNRFTRASATRYFSGFFAGSLLLLITGVSSAIADDDVAAASEPVAAALPAPIQEKASAYQRCINSVMSTFESIAAKREQIAGNCQVERAALVNVFPEQIRPLIATNTDRRIEGVLYALEQIEGVVIQSAADVNEISAELQALDNAVDSQ